MKKIEIFEIQEIENIILSSNTCSLAMIDNNEPYCVPMNFGYDNGIIYFHGSRVGRKIDVLKKNPNVCVSFYSDESLNIRHENVACSYSMRYKSVLVTGKITFVEGNDKKAEYLNIIMQNYTNRNDFKYSKPALDNVCVYYLALDNFTAYKRGY